MAQKAEIATLKRQLADALQNAEHQAKENDLNIKVLD